MTGAQARWDEFAANPGAITTEAIITGLSTGDQQVNVDAFIASYTEVPEGASTAALTPKGLVAYVEKYAEVTGGADVSGLTPEIAECLVAGYKELASGADVSLLKPDEIVAYVSSYAQQQGVDISALSPEGVTAFVMAYEEATGGALTTALTPDDVTAMVAKYLQAENVDLSALTPDQIEAIVSRYAEATGCDKSQLLPSFTAYITEYKEAEGVSVPKPKTQVIITGYDYLAYRQLQNNPDLTLELPVRLGELPDGELDKLMSDGKVKFWKDGVEVPIEAVPDGTIDASTVASLDQDGTLHILITPEITGTKEAIDALSPVVDETDKLGVTMAGMWAGIRPATTMDKIDSALGRIQSYQETLDYNAWDKFWASVFGASTNLGALDQSMKSDFNPEIVAEMSSYVAEVVSAIHQGVQVPEEDLNNLQSILDFLNGLDMTGTGAHIREGIAQGMTEAGFDSDAETVASNLETALNTALDIHSPSQRVKPVGEYVSAGVGEGMGGYDFTSDAGALAASVEAALTSALPGDVLSSFGTSAVEGLASALSSYSMSSAGASVASGVRTAVSTNLTATTLRSAGINAMAGLRAGILAGRSGVISAMRSAAREAVNAAKKELKIKSPSQVFRDEVGVMTMRGFGAGVLKESKEQAKVIRNASRFLTGEAREGSIVTNSSDNRKTYNNNVSSTIQDAAITKAKIAEATIGELNATAITAISAKIQELAAKNITTDELYAALATIAVAQITAANIEKANINWADIGELAAQIATIAQAQITTANINNANIDWASIANLNAEIAKIAKAQITAANIESAAIDWAAIKDLNAAVAKIALAQLTTANINNAEIDWASIGQLQADIAKLVNANIQTADIDWAQIKDLTAGTAIIEKGVNGKLYVADLAVTEANMASLTVGELIIKGTDGCFYALSIAENGTVTTEKKSVGDSDISDNSVSGGKLIEKTITARELNVASIFADEALVGAITAANIDVSSLFAAEAFISQLNAVDISGNESLRLVVDAAKDEALDATGEAVAQITLTAEQIRSEVKRDYATSDQMSQVTETLSTLAEQSENNFTWTVTKVNEIIEDAAANDNLTREQLNLIHTYMRFGEDGLTIGKAGNPLTFRVVNDRLAFYMNDTEVAYLSDNKLYVTQAEILARLQIGKFAYEPQSNGNLSVIYTG